MEEISRDSEMVSGHVIDLTLAEFPGDTVDGFIRVIVRMNAAPAFKELNQFAPNRQVLRPGKLSVVVQMGEQRVECLAIQTPFVLLSGKSVHN